MLRNLSTTGVLSVAVFLTMDLSRGDREIAPRVTVERTPITHQDPASRKASESRLSQLEKDMQDVSKFDDVEKELSHVEAASSDMSLAYSARISELKRTLLRQRLKQLEARGEAAVNAAGVDLSKALDVCEEADALASQYLARASKATFDKEIIATYKLIVDRTDSITDNVLTKEYIASVKERDLLSEGEAGVWQHTDGVVRTMLPGAMKLKSVPRTDGKSSLSLVSLDARRLEKPWRAYVLDLEFTINSYNTAKAGFDLLHRYLPEGRPMDFGFSADVLGEGKAFAATYTVQGSRVELIHRQAGNPAPLIPIKAPLPILARLEPNMNRQGSFAFALDAGVEVTITKCRVRILRPRS